ncbi:MAG TPA: tetratricopeptide repeat protein [Myxococcaceae bacterium]|nr:tetratricopeptide repeat protein [Myxococcaceae bacterium]
MPTYRTLLCLSVLLLPAFAFAAEADALATLDDLYARRDDPAAVKELQASLDAALKATPDDYDLLWRASRLSYWVADGFPDGDQKKKLGRQGWDIAERALKKNPKGVEAAYFAACNIGAYSQAVGILSALAEGLEGKFNERLDFAMKANPGFDHGGPLIAKGRYFFELPWPKRDLDKSLALLKRATEQNPESLRSYVYLAETLLDMGKAKEAKETLAKAVNGPVTYDPPEAQRSKAMAKKLMTDKKELR